MIDAPSAASALLLHLDGAFPPTRQQLEAEGLWVTVSHDPAEAEQRLQTLRPDLLLVELGGDRPEDWQVVQRLSIAPGSPPILALVQDATPETRLAAFASGADDVLATPFEPSELLARTQALTRRAPARTEAPTALRFRDLELDLEGHLATLGGEALSLTPLEFRFLRTLLEHPRRSFSREELLARVHVFDDQLPSDRSIDLHVAELRTKLGDSASAPRYIETVRGLGYRLAQPGKRPAPERRPAGLQHRVALVAGADLARAGAIADDLATAGLTTILAGETREARAVADGIVRRGGRAEWIDWAPADGDKVADGVAAVAHRHQRIDVLVWTTSPLGGALLAETSPEAWGYLHAANLGGLFRAAQPALPGMLERGWGRIVCVLPAPAGDAAPAGVAAAAVADGLVGFVRALAAETAGTGITANVVRDSGSRAFSATDSRPLARTVRLLLSDDAADLTGQVVAVGG